MGYILNEFKLEYGKILEDVNVEYFTSGVPKYDEEGYITNAIVFCSTFKGKDSVLHQAHEYLRNEGEFYKDDFFFIVITPFGIPDSYSPSTSGLNQNFPEYALKDMVNFKRQFIFEKFKIKKLFGIIGEEVGGYEVFTWACEYPDDMKFIMVLNGDYKVSGYRYVISKGFERIIESNNDYDKDNYAASLSHSMMAIYTILFAQSMSEKVFSTLSKDEIEIYMEDFVDESLSQSIYDFNFRNNAVMHFNVEDKLENIKAKTLVIYSNESILFNQHLDIEKLENSVDDLNILSYSSKRKDYYDEEDFSEVGLQMISFLKSIK